MVTQSINVLDLDGENGFRLVGAQGSGFSGTWVSNVGDVNGDGFDDVIVSGFNLISYVVFGKADGFDATFNLSNLDGSNGFRLDSGASSVSSAGDVNGDGLDDLILGRHFGGAYYNSGSSYVVLGKTDGFDATLNLSDLDGGNGFRLDGAAAYDYSGFSVSNAGDINGDGFDDVIIGAYGADPNGNSSGSSYVVFGKSSGFDATMNLSVLDGSNGFRLDGGSVVTNAGDVNGDGFDDVMIGGSRIDANGDRSGTGYIVFGKSSGFEATMNLSVLDGSNGFRLDGGVGSISNAGDVNGDGFADLIIGDSAADLNGRNSGSSYVVFGKSSGFDAVMNLSALDGSNGFRLDGATINDLSGRSVSSAGDVNDDGFDDLIIGAPLANPQGVLTGSSYVVFGRASGFDAAMNLSDLDGDDNGFRIDGPKLTAFDGAVYDRPFGGSVSGAGDMNGDGFDDLIVNAPNSSSNGDDSGPGYVIFGRSEFTDGGVDFPPLPEVREPMISINLSSLDGGNGFRLNVLDRYYLDAISLNSVGDMNGDGFDDMGIGLVFEKYYGGSYVLFGKASGFDATVDLSGLDGKNGFAMGGRNQSFVEGVGDINGDGFDDATLITGSTGPYSYSFYSSAYIIFGKSGDIKPGNLSNLDGNTGFRIEGIPDDDFTGRTFSGAGDINGDGFDDVIIGSEYTSYQNNDDDASYVVFGKSSGFDAVVDVAGLNGSNGFRINGSVESVSNAGDINGDGLDDVIVDGNIVFGKSSGFDATMNLSDLDGSNGFHIDGTFGGVSSAGDINGDGIDDIIIGRGIVFGRSSGFEATLNLSDLDGNNGFLLDRIGSGSGFFDNAISGAGDVNGDGFDDLIFSSSGFSYVMFGKASGFDATVKVLELDRTNSVRFDGASRWVSGAGDVNGDGFDDLMVADPGSDPGDDAAYVIFGKSQFAGTVTYVGIPENNDVFTGTEAAERFDAGDGNDLLIGGGGADVMYGGLDDDTIRVPDLDFELVDGGKGHDTLALDGSGIHLDLADVRGKINGIETIDLSGNGNNTLKLTTAELLALPSDTSGTLIVKGDFGDEITVRGNHWVDGGIQGGFHTYKQNGAVLKVDEAVRVEFSDIGIINLSGLNGKNGFRLDGVDARDDLGRLVSSAGDVNGDGFDDLMVGTPYADPNGLFSGSTYVVFGKASEFDAKMDLSSLDGSNGFRLDGVKNSDWSGDSFSDAGDMNGDGFDDLIIGAYRAGNFSGYSYVVFGKSSGFSAVMNLSDLDGKNGFRMDGEVGGRSGASVSSVGDVNSDGFDDVIVTAGTTDSSYVVFGKASGFSATMKLSGLNGSDGFRLNQAASSVSRAGDVNGDGFGDVIIGGVFGVASNYISSNYVVFGKASGFDATMDLSGLDGTNGFRLDGEAIFDSSGSSVAGAGDVNGDGFDDVIIGAFRADPNGNESGSTYVIFGKASGFDATMNLSGLDGINGFRLDGEAVFDHSGISVDGAGDVNGDGFDDLIISAANASPNGALGSGSSYVVFGKVSGFDSTMDLSSIDGNNGFRLDGEAEGDRSGLSVSSAGDVNGDGFDDLIVGAPDAAANGDESGSSYIIFGRSSFSDEVDFPSTPGDDIFTGTKAAENFEGGDGNDRMIGRGGADSFDGGAGNDYIRILGDDFQHVDGGTGTDTLGFAGSGFNLDLSSVIDNIRGIETIALYGVGDNTLTLTAQDVIDLSDTTNTLKVKGNAGDSVVGLSSGWTDGGVHGNFHTYTQDDAVLLIGVNVTTDFA
ncbi:beta strand repeat-containing protein [Nitrosomonas ureae]|uniref:FG-GAP repeat protein n=1 Tax=Nitrosomonas ureae TaxID=44577 RepID=A0A2T5IIH1_9PROT|nr:FG-GAP repeat protein [Nitrosomonas ureae]PTQ83589.1 FG-GAP repeat protein [Nitrosomonas ureae]